MAQRRKTSGDSFYDKEGFYSGTCWGLTLSANLGMVIAGYIGGVLNTIQGYLADNVFHWDKDEASLYGGLMNSILCGGGAAGTLMGGVMAKTFGRRNTMLIADVFGLVGAIFTMFASLPVFLAGRALIGFAGGVNCTVVPLYVTEVNPLPLRGPTGSAIQAAASLGTLVALLLGFGMPQDGSPTFWWRFMLGLPIAICTTRIILMTTVYNIEPAKYLISKGRMEEAEKSLDRIFIRKYVQEQMQAVRAEIEQQSSSKEMKFSDLFTPFWRYRFLIGIFIAASPQLTFVTGISFYSTILFKNNGNDQVTSQILTCVMMALTLAANFGAGVVISKVGRKPLLYGGAAIMALLWVSVTVFMKFEMNVAAEVPFFVFFVIFGFTYGPVPWIYVAEVLPDVAIGVALFLNYVVQVIVAQTFPLLLNFLPGSFLIPGVITLVVFFIVIFFVKETKDKTPQEIGELYAPEASVSPDSPDSLAKSLVAGNKITDASSDGSNIWV